MRAAYASSSFLDKPGLRNKNQAHPASLHPLSACGGARAQNLSAVPAIKIKIQVEAKSEMPYPQSNYLGPNSRTIQICPTAYGPARLASLQATLSANLALEGSRSLRTSNFPRRSLAWQLHQSPRQPGTNQRQLVSEFLKLLDPFDW